MDKKHFSTSVDALSELAKCDDDRESPPSDLMTPLSVRSVVLRNRIGVSPMCMYSAEDGFAGDFHLVHLGSRAMGGAGLVIMEATAVLPEGRISPQDTGLWKDDHIGPLRKITDFISQHGAVPGIQLAHAGRKASTRRPMDGGGLLAPEDGGWGTVAPSPISFRDGEPLPTAMTEDAIGAVIEAWKEAARRALEAGFGLVEIHAAHGYLLHEFLSPLSNHRDDEYGGSLENRMRLVLEVASAVRGVLGEAIPLFVRISATDWVEGGWDPHQAVELCRRLKDVGVDLIDCSSGGIVPHARIPVARGYQVAFARKIREEAMISTAAVGLITEPEQANDIITGGDADLVLIGREMLRNAYWAINAQHALDAEQTWPLQYGYAFKRR